MNRYPLSNLFRACGTGHPMRLQQGMALAVSLVLLAAMTVAGIATLSGARLNERIASNGHQQSVAFEAVESAIRWAWSSDTVLGSLTAGPVQDYHEPPVAELEELSESFSTRFDQVRDGRASIDVEGVVTVRYCGESVLPLGSDLNADTSRPRLVATLFDVNGIAVIDGSATRGDHIQRGSLTRPATGRRGGCTVPGEAS